MDQTESSFRLPEDLQGLLSVPMCRFPAVRGAMLESWVQVSTAAVKTKRSGALHHDGDLVSQDGQFFIECKFKGGTTVYLAKDDWQKAKNQASRFGRIPVVVVSNRKSGAFYYESAPGSISKRPLQELQSFIGGNSERH